MFILAIILAVAGLVGLVLGRSLRKKPAPTSSYDTNPQTVGTVFKWSGVGVLVAGLILAGFSSFYTQDVGEVLAPQSVLDAYSLAQKSQIEVQKATNDLNATKVSAQQKVVQAQADADANAILGSSLTPQILQQRYLDTLKTLAAKGNLVVVPEGFNGLVSVR